MPIKNAYPYDEVVDFAKGVAKLVVDQTPKTATIERLTKNRKPQQVYVDYLQNLEGKSVAAAYSVREKPGATVSTPITWQEIKRGIKISDFTIKNVPARVKKKGDILQDSLTKKQSLVTAQKRLERVLLD